jgi:hypothetical protein
VETSQSQAVRTADKDPGDQAAAPEVL